MLGAIAKPFTRHRRHSLALLLAMSCLTALPQAVPSATIRASSSASSLYRIAGKVVNAVTGEIVRHATVALLAEEDSHTVESVETDNDGAFALECLPAAKYQLTASKRGFRTSFYDEHDEFSSAIVTGPDQDTGDIVFRLMPNAALRGVVTADGGDTVEGARVMLFLVPPDRGRDRTRGRGPNERIAQVDQVTTDDTGAYEFSNLAAGTYLLAVTAEPWYSQHHTAHNSRQQIAGNASAALDVAYSTTFYDSTTDENSATPIVLAPGGHEEANISLHAVPALHLMVQAPHKPDGSIAQPELRQSIFGTQISAEGAGFLDAMKAGTAEFTGVAPGHYELAQGDPPRIVNLEATVSHQVDPADGAPTFAVSGTLLSGNGSALPNDISVALYSRDGSHRPDQLMTTARQGSFRFDAVLPGDWELWIWGAGRVLPITSISANGSARAGNILKVHDRPMAITAVVLQGETRIEGFAKKSGKGQAGVMVVLVPKNKSVFEASVRRDQSDSDGSFSLRDAAPGQYTIVAIEDGWELDWTRPETMSRFLSQGIAVTVTENSGKLTHLSAPVPVQSR